MLIMSSAPADGSGHTAAYCPRLLVLTDIGGDPDDQQSMVRLLAHGNEFDIVGLIATSRMGHGADTKPELIEGIVRAYGDVQPNLARHAAGYRPAAELLPLITSGNPAVAGHDFAAVVGAGRHTDGSDRIIVAVDAVTDGRPVNICIWGGAADLAQALFDVRRTRSPEATAEFVSRIRVHAIDDRDGTGAWIRAHFPDLWYVDSADLPGMGQSGPYRGMYQNDTRTTADPTRGVRVAPPHGDDANKWDELVSLAWVDEHVHGHGPLGDRYPVRVWQGPTAWFLSCPTGSMCPTSGASVAGADGSRVPIRTGRGTNPSPIGIRPIPPRKSSAVCGRSPAGARRTSASSEPAWTGQLRVGHGEPPAPLTPCRAVRLHGDHGRRR